MVVDVLLEAKAKNSIVSPPLPQGQKQSCSFVSFTGIPDRYAVVVSSCELCNISSGG